MANDRQVREEKNAVSSCSSLQCVSRTPSQARRDDIAVRYFSKRHFELLCVFVCLGKARVSAA